MTPDDPPWRFFSDRFVFNQRTGEFFLLSAEGAHAFRMAIDGARADRIAESLIKEFGVEPTAALRDAEQFCARLRGLKLVQAESSASQNPLVLREKAK